MFSTFNIADHVLAVSFKDKVDKDSIDKLRKLVEDRLQKEDYLNLFFEIEDKKGFTFPALLQDFAFHFKKSSSFEKIAIVSNSEMLQKLMDLKDLFLNSEIQTFDIEDRIEAMNWVMNKIPKNTLEN